MPEPVEAAPMCFACGKENPIGLKIDFKVVVVSLLVSSLRP